MLLSRPRRAREILTTGLAALFLAVLLAGSLDLAHALMVAGALGGGLAFGVFSLRTGWGVLARSAAALAVTLVALALWASIRGIGWPQIDSAFQTFLASGYRTFQELTTDPALKERIRETVELRVPTIARLFPGFLSLAALAGMALAAAWHHRLAAEPRGSPPARFRDFRFNDHLIWGAIFTLALTLAPLPPDGRTLAANLLVIWAGLYAARGLAVVVAVMARAPLLFRLLVVIPALVAGVLTAAACLAIGLADTWLDFRRRLMPPEPQGVSS